MSYKIEELQNPTRFLVKKSWCWLFPRVYVACTWGDGVGNDTGVPVILPTKEEAEDYIKKEEDFKKRYGL